MGVLHLVLTVDQANLWEWVKTFLPATLVLVDIFCTLVGQLKCLRTRLHYLSAPFRNFLTLEDLLDPVDDQPRPTALQSRVLTALAAVSAAGWLARLVFTIWIGETQHAMRCLVCTVSWACVTIAIAIRPPRTPPYLFMAFASSLSITSLVDIIHNILMGKYAVVDFIAMMFSTTFVWVAGTLPLKTYRPALNVAQSKDMPFSDLSCPEDDVNLWSWSGFTFLNPILLLASQRTLNETDVWSLSPFFRHKNLFTKCLHYRVLNPTHSLLRFLVASNSLDIILDISLEMWSAVVGFVPPYALKEILSALAADTPEGKRVAFYWTLLTFIAHLSFAQADLFQGWHARRCYERTRGQLFCTLHYKALKRQEISGRIDHEKGKESNADLGKIVNLMQGDSYMVAQRFWDFSAIATSPVRIIIALVFLYQILGWSALSGVVVVSIAYALNYPLAKYNIYITRSAWKAKDTRMNLVNELLQNIRFLKFYGWEYQWARNAQDARETELRWRVKENVVDTLISFIWIWMPSATALTSFLCYTLIAGEKLTVSKAFTSIALFSQLQEPMVALPGQFFAILNAYVSMQRIEEFLGEDEVPRWASTLTATPTEQGFKEVKFCDATFEWEKRKHPSATPSRFQLGPLNLTFPQGSLSLVIGATGSGKSALLAALLGEMHCKSGQVSLDKTLHQVAFCAQVPWLEHATIRDNIIFGSPFVLDRYNAVLDACALRPDLAVFDAGDLTEIGEKGITLSGGQRARIALARAMYSQAKCILLDDPLASVDMHTAQHLVEHCLNGELVRGRTIILVTHHIALCLPTASYLVEIEQGRVIRQASIQELKDQGIFSTVVQTQEKSPSQEHCDPRPKQNEADALGINDRSKLPRQATDGKLIEAEARAEGRVSTRTYMTYIRAAGLLPWLITITLLLLIRFINIGNQFFLAKWGEAYQDGLPALMITTFSGYPWTGLPSPDVDVKPWLRIYLYISTAGAFSVFFYIAVGYYASLQASRSLFVSLLQRLTRAPSRFFDVTPIGRILNRFTTDINTIDGALQNSARSCLSGILNFVASFLVILSVVPSFAPFALFIGWLYIRLAPPYINASRDLRRLESISLSPAFAGFDELLRGITHIRAFGMEDRYQNRFYLRVDKFQCYDHIYWLVNGWLRWRYDCLGSVVVFAATMFALWRGVSNGSAAIVIVQAGIFAEASRQLVRVAAQLELDFNSVERVTEYLNIPQEAPAIIMKSRPPAYWPSSNGQLVVEDLVIKYAPHLPPVLRNLTFTVKAREKIGVVGRTGSGKSTLAMSLLRMVEPTAGTILIDGIDISTLGLEDLRTRVTILSQDVSLFSGTIQSNLDPLGHCTPEECLVVLERCHLTTILNHTPTADEPTILDMRVNHGSLSAGEKQLLAVARATLRRTNIIILDEATSQVDSHLDDQIQKTIREELSDAIVITIAHRLKTVVDYDRILVLDDGKIVEFGDPRSLLSIPSGAFREMCRKSADWPMFEKLIDS
ncbi:hypothetical protein K443DRAFT_129256 [Laccaria amethystina LaAM-08-1]|uniref:P-loop containing nucleoside triphosphate hydrolase protein n=1 Tax=Laccaria amethystina LaAM-08-1 TaxID=1095629 RepID=A0A0C9X4Y7_9AGAR|nr:hypothetical protein K443DRAFT_129256 [Laccaria amethystina LaAM-08-1]